MTTQQFKDNYDMIFKRNPIAKEVRTPKYKIRTVKPKKGRGSFSRLKNIMTEKQWIDELTKGRK
jgi:stalled ribosome alternative rescue factor ArfA